MTKFYHFNQNNSGGVFVRDEHVCHHVIIEANNYVEANIKAVGIGIYFNGCETGDDCDCCGDRWFAQWDFGGHDGGMEEPLIYDRPIEELNDAFTPVGEVYARVYYRDGEVREYKRQPE